MLEMGDELWRTQRGNNNAYCQDSDLTWVDWRATPETARHRAPRRERSLALRVEHGVFRRRGFLRGVASPASRGKDITWLRPDGGEMTAE